MEHDLGVADAGGKARGVAVFPASGANDVSVAEYVIATAMLLLRGAYGATARMAAGEWPRNALSNGREMMGATLGLVGFGSIARETARRASAMGMTIQAFDPMLDEGSPAWDQPFGRVAKVPLETLLRTSDVVSLHVPLTADTRRMIDASALGSMQPPAILINAARGGVVDEAALAENGLTEDDISTALDASGLSLPGGSVTDGDRTMDVVLGQSIDSLESLEGIVLMPSDGASGSGGEDAQGAGQQGADGQAAGGQQGADDEAETVEAEGTDEQA